MAKADDTQWTEIHWVTPPKQTTTGYWVIKFKPAGHGIKSRTRKSESEIQALSAHLRSLIPAKAAAAGQMEGRDCPEFDGSLRWFLDMLGRMSRELYLSRDADLRQDIKAIASAGIAAKNLFDQSQMEAEFSELKSWVEEIKAGWKHGTRITSKNNGNAAPVKPGPSSN
jgi:hypothetical protein